MHDLFRIPELLHYILLSVPSPKASEFLDFALVSKSWAANALPLLWGHPRDTWIAGWEFRRLAGVVDIEMEVRLTRGSRTPFSQANSKQKGSGRGAGDFPRAFAYGSYLRSLSIVSEYDAKERSTIQLLLTQGVAFPSLRSLEYWEEGELDENSAISIFLQVLGPKVEKVIYSTELGSPHRATRFGLAMRRIVDVCPELKTYDVSFTDGASPIPRAILESHLPSLAKLTTLALSGVIHTRYFIQQLSSLPCLVSFKSSSADVGPDEIQQLIGKRERGFAKLTTLTISDTTDVVKEFLYSIADHSNIREISLFTTEDDGDETQNWELFPSCFSPRNIESLTIDNADFFTANILASIGRFHTLRTLRFSESYVNLITTDMQLVAALYDCPHLEKLLLPGPVNVYHNRSGSDALSLGCLAPILSRCPLLQHIAGCFRLDQQKISSQGGIVPHSKLNILDLGSSYFVTREPEGWIPTTVGYLSSLAQQPCIISLSESESIHGLPREEGAARLTQRKKSVAEFIQYVEAANLAGLHVK